MDAVANSQNMLHPSDGPAGGSAAETPDETAYLLAQPANAARLLASLADARAGRVVEHGLIEE